LTNILDVTKKLLTYSMVQDILWKADSHSACQTTAKESVQVRGALNNFVTLQIFYGEGLLASRSTPKLEDHPKLGVHDRLFKYIRSYPPYLGVFLPSATWGRAMSWWQGTRLTWVSNIWPI